MRGWVLGLTVAIAASGAAQAQAPPGACDRASEKSPQDFYDEAAADQAAFTRSVPGRRFCMEIPLDDVDWKQAQAVRSTGLGHFGGSDVASYQWPTMGYWVFDSKRAGYSVRRLQDQQVQAPDGRAGHILFVEFGEGFGRGEFVLDINAFDHSGKIGVAVRGILTNGPQKNRDPRNILYCELWAHLCYLPARFESLTFFDRESGKPLQTWDLTVIAKPDRPKRFLRPY